MRPFKSLISVDNALSILLNNVKPVNRTEFVPLLELVGRVSAEDIVAECNVPPFRRAAMDGYAVIAEDTFGASDSAPVKLTCVDKVLAGETTDKVVERGTCIEIATGAMIPEGANCVVPVEYTNRNENVIEIIRAFAPQANVSLEGVDIKKGEIVVRKGDVFTPGRIGVLASLNMVRAKVFERPLVAVIPTGKEIAPLGSELKKAQVYDINSYTMTTLLKQHGANPVLYDIVPDDYDALEQVVMKSLDADFILILGGSSVGERDINIDVIRHHGKILFHGVQLKPGKPTLAGIINDKLVLNLPGYPTSCLTNGYVLVAPLIRKMAHLPPIDKKTIKAKLQRKIVSRLGRHQIFTVRIENDVAIPAFKESGAITSIAWADGYIEIPYNVDLIEEGEEVEVVLFYW
ncbi:MAG: molybdenum cofactor synthesis domain-containing protein [Candidatus Heimdallarchaeaceae archaeon]